MKSRLLMAVCAAALFAGGAAAQPTGGSAPTADDAPIFGSQIMTPEERIEHRDRMRAAKTLDERERIRAEHHDQMVKRAKERGVTLPEEPPMRGGAMMGPGAGMGGGPGPSGGMGGGPRR